MGRTVEEQQGRILPREDFNLISFKINSKGDGIFIKHHLGGTDPQTQTNDVDVKPHPDLKTTIDQLKVYMATSLGLVEGWDFSREHLKKNPNYLQKAIQGHKDAVSRCNINGFSYQGDGETAGVQITGSIKTPTGGSIGMAVPKISFEKDTHGFEDEVKEICKEIEDEVYNYLILKKKEQASVEDQAEGFDNVGGFSDPAQTSILDAQDQADFDSVLKPEDDSDPGSGEEE